jgi:hypothetical protein
MPVGNDIVFAGPTLAAAEVASLLPSAQVRPPVRHGDLLGLDLGPGDRVLIIDGLFLHTASVRHREILYLLGRGVTVAGSSSMGALRAAELWQYGMRGYGEIFRMYRDGEIDGDDEVAIVHGTADDGHKSYSDPLVSIRIALREAVADGAISGRDAALLLDLAVAMPFRARSFRGLDHTARGHGRLGQAEAFAAWLAGRDTDAKAADARLMLSAAAGNDPAMRPAGPGDEPVRNVHTWLFEMWEHRFHGGQADGEWVSDAEAAGAIRLASPGYRDAYRRHVLARITGTAPDHPALVEHAASVARAKGICVTPNDLPDQHGTGSWLTERDLRLPEDEALATLLARAFGAHFGQNKWTLPPEYRTAAALSWGRDFVLAARQCNDRLLRAPDGGPRRRFKAEATDKYIARLWGCDVADLQAQAWDRGIADLAALRQIGEPFVAHLKVFGVPDATASFSGAR